MAAPVVRGGIFKAVVTTVIILAVIVGVTALVANITPNQIGLGSININGKTLDELGLADCKVKDIFTAIKSLSTDATALVEDPISEESAENAEALLYGSSIVDDQGEVDYTAIYNEKVVYEEAAQIEYQDDELGALADKYLQQAIAASAFENSGRGVLAAAGNNVPSAALKEETQLTMDDFKVKIEALTITAAEKTKVKIVVSFDLTKLTEDPQAQQILNSIEETGFITVPDPLVVIVQADLEVVYDSASESISLGDDNSILIQNNQILTNSLFSLFEEQAEYIRSTAVNQVGDVFCRIVNNLGKVKSVETGKIIFETFTISDM